MPGSPDPVLGSVAVTWAVAISVAALIALTPVVLRRRNLDPFRLGICGAVASVLLCLGVWAGARVATDSFASSLFEHPGFLVGMVLTAAVILGAQVGIPYYLYARWGLLLPLVGAFALTALCLVAFLGVRGESEPLGLYTLFFGPMLVGGVCLVALLEASARHLIDEYSS